MALRCSMTALAVRSSRAAINALSTAEPVLGAEVLGGEGGLISLGGAGGISLSRVCFGVEY